MTPQVDPDAWIAPTSVIVGDVTIGSGSSVWYFAVVRADHEAIVIGRDTNIQDGCVLHADPGQVLRLGDRVTVGHRAVLHGCTIADDVLIGMGAIVLNGAVLESGTLVAAGAVVPEGMHAPPGSLLAGVPARIKSTLSLDQIETMVKPNPRVYAELRALPVHRDHARGAAHTP